MTAGGLRWGDTALPARHWGRVPLLRERPAGLSRDRWGATWGKGVKEFMIPYNDNNGPSWLIMIWLEDADYHQEQQDSEHLVTYQEYPRININSSSIPAGLASQVRTRPNNSARNGGVRCQRHSGPKGPWVIFWALRNCSTIQDNHPKSASEESIPFRPPPIYLLKGRIILFSAWFSSCPCVSLRRAGLDGAFWRTGLEPRTKRQIGAVSINGPWHHLVHQDADEPL